MKKNVLNILALSALIGLVLGSFFWSIAHIWTTVSLNVNNTASLKIDNTVSHTSFGPVRTLNIPKEKAVGLVGEINLLSGSLFMQELEEKIKTKDEVFILINSPGGSVPVSKQIILLLETSPVPVYTICVLTCASAAAIIHQHGFQRYITMYGYLLFHNFSMSLEGPLHDMQFILTDVTNEMIRTNTYIAKRAGKDPKTFIDRVLLTYVLMAEDSIKEHFSDELVNVRITN